MPHSIKKLSDTYASSALSAFAFETPRVRVRILDERDRELFCRLFTDEETMRFIGRPLSDHKAARSFEAALRANARCPNRDIYLSIVPKSASSAIGIGSVQRIDAGLKRAEIGIMLEPGLSSQGLGSEVLPVLIDATFGKLHLEQVWVQYDSANARAKRLFEGARFIAPVTSEPSVQNSSVKLAVLTRSSWRPAGQGHSA